MIVPTRAAHRLKLERVVYIVAILCGLNFWSTAVLDPDLSWHLFGGAQIAAHGIVLNPFDLGSIVPQQDLINTFGARWHDYHWLAQLVFYGIYSLGGYELLAVALGILMAYLAKVIVDIIYRATPTKDSPLVVLAMALAALFLVRGVTTVRPQAIALLLLALAIRCLESKERRLEILYLFVLCVVGANVHVYWIFIPFLWFLYRCLPRGFRHRTSSPLQAWGGLFVLASAGVVSPYGIFGADHGFSALLSNYAIIWDYLGTPSALSSIAEFKPLLSTIGWGSGIFLIYAAVFVRTFDPRRFLVALSEGCAAVIPAFLALSATKFVAVFAILSLPYLSRVAMAGVRRAELRSLKKSFFTTAILGICAAVAFVRAIIHFPSPGSRIDAIAQVYPVEACREIAKLQPAPSMGRSHVRVLTHFNYGGACRWAMFQSAPNQDIRVTTDGRTQGVPNDHFEKSSDLYALQEGWDVTLAQWNPDYILTSREYALSFLLFRATKEWEPVYRGNQFAVFRRVR